MMSVRARFFVLALAATLPSWLMLSCAAPASRDDGAPLAAQPAADEVPAAEGAAATGGVAQGTGAPAEPEPAAAEDDPSAPLVCPEGSTVQQRPTRARHVELCVREDGTRHGPYREISLSGEVVLRCEYVDDVEQSCTPAR